MGVCEDNETGEDVFTFHFLHTYTPVEGVCTSYVRFMDRNQWSQVPIIARRALGRTAILFKSFSGGFIILSRESEAIPFLRADYSPREVFMAAMLFSEIYLTDSEIMLCG